MEYHEQKNEAVNWATNRFSVAEEIAEEMANHWMVLHDTTPLSYEEIILKMLPMALDILKKHPDFSKSRHWEF
jgi:hypothetical protein